VRRLSIARSQSETTTIPRDWRKLLDAMPDQVREAWEERAAIIEYDGCEPRPTAERRAFECMLDQFEEARAVLAAAAGEAGRTKRRA
jgi:hypothetical protein